MRRSEREITDRAAIDAVIRECTVCRLGLSDDGEPYIVPLCFGYDGKAVWFHVALEGRKLDIIRRNDRVCLEFDASERPTETQDSCRWTLRYRSVIAWGKAEIVEDLEEKRAGLAALIAQYSDRKSLFPDAAVRNVGIIRVIIERVTGKQSAG